MASINRIDPEKVAAFFKEKGYYPSYDWIYLRAADSVHKRNEVCVTGAFLAMNGFEEKWLSGEWNGGMGSVQTYKLTGNKAYTLGLQIGWTGKGSKENMQEISDTIWKYCPHPEKYESKEQFLGIWFEETALNQGIEDGTKVRNLLNFRWKEAGFKGRTLIPTDKDIDQLPTWIK